MQVLSFKLNVGNFPHLADLVTRINYNYFYMSDSGNLMTVPNLENAASRARKAFVSRTDWLVLGFFWFILEFKSSTSQCVYTMWTARYSQEDKMNL